jgi:hypothetical protein
MVTTIFGDVGTRTAPGRSVLRRFLGRMITSGDTHVRRPAIAARLGFDDARLAVFGYGRKSVDFAGRGPFPL